MKKCLSINDLSDGELTQIINVARDCMAELQPETNPEGSVSPGFWRERFGRELLRLPVGLVFLEPSTRTRVSFERAAQVLGCKTVLVESKGSAFEKEETLEDGLEVLESLGVRLFVIRCPKMGQLEALRGNDRIAVVNAGDGVGEHPSQALLDLFVLMEAMGERGLRGLRLGILGDIRHSRVARSWSKLAPRMGMELRFIGPEVWMPDDFGNGIECFDDKVMGLKNLDVVMALRVQKERIEKVDQGISAFVKGFQLELQDLRAGQFLMHPGPVNWGVELAPNLHGAPKSLVRTQLQHSLALRSSLLAHLCSDYS